MQWDYPLMVDDLFFSQEAIWTAIHIKILEHKFHSLHTRGLPLLEISYCAISLAIILGPAENPQQSLWIDQQDTL